MANLIFKTKNKYNFGILHFLKGWILTVIKFLMQFKTWQLWREINDYSERKPQKCGRINITGRTWLVWHQDLPGVSQGCQVGKTKQKSASRANSELHPSRSVCTAHQKCTQLATGCHSSLTLLSLGVLASVSVYEYAMSWFTTTTEGTDSPVQASSIWDHLLFLHKIDFRFWAAQKGLEDRSDLKCGSQPQAQP